MAAKSLVREWLEIILITVVLVFILRTFFIQAYKIPSGSMIKTLLIGDRFMANKIIYGINMPFTNKPLIHFADPAFGDVIVFIYPADPSIDFVKRVIGLPGDSLEIRDRILYRNGERVQEDYVYHAFPQYKLPFDNFKPLTVPAGHYFVMGDNRDNSKDSREWGYVPRENIRGKAWRLFWSYGPEGVRWSRIGKSAN